MKTNQKFLISAVAFTVALAICSCVPSKVQAVEIGVGDQAGIYDYLEAGSSGMQQIDFALDSDEDGNRSVRLKIYGLQQLAFSEQAAFYENLDFSVAPDTMTLSGGGAAGFYRTEQNGEVKPVTISVILRQGNSGAFVSAPDFTFEMTAPSNYYTKVEQMSDLTDRLRWSCQSYYSSGSSSVRELVGSGIGQGVQFASYTNYNTVYFGMWKEQIPVLNGVLPGSSGSGSPAIIGGLGQSVVLPSGTVDTDEPWNYYNDVLLPYMEQEFPGYDQYFVFPDGYQPPETPTQIPTEYPVLPGFDYALETNGTAPADDYNYNVPEMPTKEIAVPAFDFTQINPAEIMAPVAGGLRTMWALITGICTEFELFPYVAIAVFCAIVVGLLKLGK